MPSNSDSFNLKVIVAAITLAIILFCIGLYRIDIDSDITALMPLNDPVVSDAGYIFSNHPIQDQLVIDIGHNRDNPDILVDGAEFVERKLKESGLFNEVGMEKTRNFFPELMIHIAENLPLMFSAKELDEVVAPMLKPERIRKKLEDVIFQLSNIDGIGQEKLISIDPFNIRDLVIGRMEALRPSQNTKIYRGHLLSSNAGHILISAVPESSATDTDFARAATALIDNAAEELNDKYAESGYTFTLSPVGAYRAALDNELIAKNDTRKALLISILGIAFLLFFSFPRPLIGLLALLPAAAGTLIALFVYSLFYKSISVLTLGFGGAIISITVDHGIAYLLFLDQPRVTYGRETAVEIRSVGLIAVVTTVGAFSVLSISGFPILAQIGRFAALGIAFSFIFVHTVLPSVFPVVRAAKTGRHLPLRSFVDGIAHSGGTLRLIMVFLFAGVMLFFAKPQFNTDLKTMNTVSRDTLESENLVTSVWGNILSRVYLMTEAESVAELQKKSDRLAEMLDRAGDSELLESSFISSMVFPGEIRGKQNFTAWKSFWNGNRIKKLSNAVEKASEELGFTSDAFAPLLETVHSDYKGYSPIPEKFFSFAGISKKKDGSKWILFSSLVPGKKYDAESFYLKTSSNGFTRIFDPGLFSKRLGDLVYTTFLKMALIVGLSVILLLFVFFLDLKLTLISILPVGFALVCTLGTLNLIGHPLDIPGLMLSIVVMGMGIDYSLFFVRSYQRYGDPFHPSVSIIRMTVFLASVSTLVGFGVLAFADHALLKSAGLISFLGIAYSLAGAFLILPTLLRGVFGSVQPPGKKGTENTKGRLKRLLTRYRHLEPYPRLFARFKVKIDPMFSEIPRFLESPGVIIDIGTGYGVVAAWILELFPETKIFGIDPDAERVRVASRVTGSRGTITLNRAPDIPLFPAAADAIILIDMMHYLDDSEFTRTLMKLHGQINPGGRLIIRATVPSENKIPWLRRIENIQNRCLSVRSFFRSFDRIRSLISRSGFRVILTEPSGKNREEVWFISVPAETDHMEQ